MAGPPSPPPPPFEQARQPFPAGLLGARVAKVFAPGPDWDGGLAWGTVTEVVNEWSEFEGGPINRGLLFEITFDEDQETDDVEWPELWACIQLAQQTAAVKTDEADDDKQDDGPGQQDAGDADTGLPVPSPMPGVQTHGPQQQEQQQVASVEGSGKSSTVGWVADPDSPLQAAAGQESPARPTRMGGMREQTPSASTEQAVQVHENGQLQPQMEIARRGSQDKDAGQDTKLARKRARKADDSPPAMQSPSKKASKKSGSGARISTPNHLQVLQQHQLRQQQQQETQQKPPKAPKKRKAPEPVHVDGDADADVDNERLLQDGDVRTPSAKQRRAVLSDEPPSTPSRRKRDQHHAAQQQQQQQVVIEDAGVADEDEERPSEAGRLLRMELRDFMCHPHLAIEFGQQVTLVSGANGSGKSAIMQALQAALGVTARNTGRGNSLKAYVRTGAPAAYVTVVLNNTGPGQLAEYGREITIQRRIAADGGGWYKLRSTGHGDAQAKREVVYGVLDRLSINAANPLTIITQDKARTFLAASANDNRNKYEMFMDGTLLGVILDHLRQSGANLVENVQRLKVVKDQVEDLQRQVEEQTQHVQKLKEVQQAKKEAQLLEDALDWLRYEAMQANTAELQARHQEWQDKQAAIQAEINNLKEERVRLQEEANAVMALIESWNVAAEQSIARQKQLKEVAKNARARFNEAKRALDQLNEEVAMYKEELDNVEVSLRQDHSAATEAARRAVEAAQAQVNAAQSADQQAHVEIQAAEAKIADAQAVKKVAEKAKQEADVACRTASEQVIDIQERMANLHSSMSDPSHLFGGRTSVMLREALKQPKYARMFSTPPVGPIGCHIKIKNSHEKWRVAADTVVGGLLNHWLVGSVQEATALRELARELKLDISKLLVAAVNMRVGPHRLPADVWPQDREATPLVLDALEFEGSPEVQAAVFNYVVDKSSADSTVLVTDDEKARDVVYEFKLGEKTNQNGKPAGVARFNAVTLEGRTFQAGGTIKIFARDRRRPPRIVRSVAAELDTLKVHLQAAQAQLAEKQQALQLTQTALAAAVEAERAQHQQRSACQKRKRQTEQAFRAACAAQEVQGAANDPASQWAAQVVDLTRQLTGRQQQQEAALRKMQAAQAALAEAEAAQQADLQATDQQSTSYDQKVKLMDRLISKDLPAQDARIKGHEQQLAGAQASVSKLASQLATQQAAQQQLLEALIQDFTEEHGHQLVAQVRAMVQERVQAQAPQRWRQAHDDKRHPTAAQLQAFVDEMVAEEMAADKLQARADRLLKKHAAVEQDAGGSLAEVEWQLTLLKDKLEKRETALKIVEDLLKSLNKGYKARQISVKDLMSSIKKKIQETFHKLLARRNHLGSVKFEDSKEELSIEVRINGRIDPNAQLQTDLKQLSGGERSLVTVAFLLAVGACAETPFRCMDEFDVFMDAINRRVATETLLENARESGRQYIFLTPQDVDGVLKAKEQLETRRKWQLGEDFLLIKKLAKPRG